MDPIELRADSQELTQFLKGLLSDLSNVSLEVRQLAFNFLQLSPELIRFEFRAASRTVMTALFKPSQRLLDLRSAIRTGDFDLLFVKYSHGELSQ